MPNLKFWDEQFYNAPYFLLALGVFKILLALYGWAIHNFKNRCLLATFSVMLVAAFIMQLVSIGFFWNVRTTILLGEVSGAKVTKMLNTYGSDPQVTNSIDYMQQHLSCCGGNEWHTGYNDYKYTSFGKSNNGVPDSCCIDESFGCGRGIYRKSARSTARKIYVNGCVGILRKWMETDILPMILAYTFVGIGIALCDLLSAVLVCAYIAQISRRHLKLEDKNFVTIIQYGMFGDKGIHYPKLPDADFVGVRVDKSKNKKTSRRKMFGLNKKQLEPTSAKSTSIHTTDDINKSVSEFLSHGIGTDNSQVSNEQSRQTYVEPESNAVSDIVTGITIPSAKVSRPPLKTILPACKIEVETYHTEPKTPKHIIDRNNPNTQKLSTTSSTSTTSDNTNKSYITGRPESRIANLRKAWIRDNITLHKHPSVLASNSLTNVTTNPISTTETREVRSLTPEKPPKPMRVRVSGYNNTQAASLETNL